MYEENMYNKETGKGNNKENIYGSIPYLEIFQTRFLLTSLKQSQGLIL